MQCLNFPAYSFRIKNSQNGPCIFDIIRKKFVRLQPEEWVRQHVVRFLNETKGYPKSLINVEKQLIVNHLKKRYDVVVFQPDGSFYILVECKAPHITIDQHTFDQMARYNLQLQAKYLVVTNGLKHYYCRMNHEQKRYQFLRALPDFKHALNP